ncbi:MAG: sulfite exporter TauE/SafE family protein [Candidatus Sungbacteria bacterium]|nr:sulfite exporter TauE/SafE family protein [Candidatus Sungbacteria bacterium]
MYIFGLVVFGIIAGIYSAFLGLGGGLLVVPLLVALGYDIRTAVATSLVVIIPTAITGVLGEWSSSNRIEWQIAMLLALGAATGALIGTGFKSYAASDTIRRVFATLLVVIALDLMKFRVNGTELTIRNLISHLVKIFS